VKLAAGPAETLEHDGCYCGGDIDKSGNGMGGREEVNSSVGVSIEEKEEEDDDEKTRQEKENKGGRRLAVQSNK
jgi:hypothetical protein